MHLLWLPAAQKGGGESYYASILFINSGQRDRRSLSDAKKLSLYELVHIHSFAVCWVTRCVRDYSHPFSLSISASEKERQKFSQAQHSGKNILLLSLAGKKGKYALCSNTLNFLKSRLFLSLSVCPAPACCVGIGAALTIVSLPPWDWDIKTPLLLECRRRVCVICKFCSSLLSHSQKRWRFRINEPITQA